MKKLLIILALIALIVTSGCTMLNPTSQPTTGSTTTFTTTSGMLSASTTTLEPIWTPTQYSPDTDIVTSTLPAGFFPDRPIPQGQAAVNQDGIEITVLGYVIGDQAWSIIHDANPNNIPPAADAQYVLITVKIRNVSSNQQPYMFWGTYFDLVAGLTKVYRSQDININIIQPASGQYQKLEASLNHGDEFTGSVYFYILKSETSLTLVWSNINNNYKFYFAVN